MAKIQGTAGARSSSAVGMLNFVRSRNDVSCPRQPLFGLNPARTKRNQLAPAFLLLLFDISKDGVQIVFEAGRVRVAHSPYFVDNRIVHGFVSKSSSGVQMIGALIPLRTQTASISGRIVALAKCRQFHVNR